MNKSVFYVFLLFAALFISPQIIFGQSESSNITIKGKVVAYDDFLFPGIGVSTQVLFIKVSNNIKGKNLYQYMLVQYIYSDRSQIPVEFYDGNKEWILELERIPFCDAKPADYEYVKSVDEKGRRLPDSVKRLKFTQSSEINNLPMDRVAPCYFMENKKLLQF